MRKPNPHGVRLGGRLQKFRRAIFDRFAVNHGAGGQRQAVGDGLLVGRMNVIRCAHVERDRHAGIAQRQGCVAGRPAPPANLGADELKLEICTNKKGKSPSPHWRLQSEMRVEKTR